MKNHLIIIAIILILIAAYLKNNYLLLIFEQLVNIRWLICIITAAILITMAFYKEIGIFFKNLFINSKNNPQVILPIFFITLGIYYSYYKTSLITIFLIITGVLILILNPIFLTQITQNIKKFKIGSFEIELENAIREIKESITETEDKEIEKIKKPKTNSNVILEEYLNKKNPEMAFVQMYIEIEKTLRTIAKNNGLVSNTTTNRIAEFLARREIIDEDLYRLIRTAIPLRNRIVHGLESDFSLDMLEIGSKILSMLQNTTGIINKDDSC